MSTPNETAKTPGANASGASAKMSQDPQRTKMVKLKALRDIRLDMPGQSDNKKQETRIKAGQEFEVPEDMVKDLTRSRRSYYEHAGEKSEEFAKGSTYKACERV